METVPLIDTTDPLWFCLKTQPKHEKLAAQFLRSQAGLEIFCPMLRVQRVTISGKKWFEEALFPGYIFGQFPYLTHYRLVASSMGVSKIIGFGGQPAVVVADDGVAGARIQHRQVGASTADRCQFLAERHRSGSPSLAGQTFPQRDHDRFGQGFAGAGCQFSSQPVGFGVFDTQGH